MSWDVDLLPDQLVAASHIGTPARMLAGPGTGKTLVITRRIVYLVQEQHINPDQILAITFTRAAAHELRQRVSAELPDQPIPRISTLHSFALRQLLRNSHRLTTLPPPLRIADDWEERHIILEDLKAGLQLHSINDTKNLFNQLSSDWESLDIDEGIRTPNPRFIGAWEEHRRIYGYTLRSELVYQLKRSLEQLEDFELETPICHLLVDEYQDLNRCDLVVINEIVERGIELFIAGDDDQSIYGFRKAHPEGIRRFRIEHPNADDIPLHVCKRCDPEILRLGEFVADLDPQRIHKETRADHNQPIGEVKILRFDNEGIEANGVARICQKLNQVEHLQFENILVLLRVDTHRAFSKELERAFNEINVPIAIDPSTNNPLEDDGGREFLSYLRLVNDPQDHLAWTTLIRLRHNGLGKIACDSIFQFLRNRGLKYFDALQLISENPDILPRIGKLVKKEFNAINTKREEISIVERESIEHQVKLIDCLRQISPILISDVQEGELIIQYLDQIISYSSATTIKDLLVSIQTTSLEIEPDYENGKVMVLTMHKAKGLTADAVIIVAAEDEHIPGRQDREPQLGDERRLLFVSLTRAKHFLYITYCNRRLGQQRMMGRNSGHRERTLTQFLRNTPLEPEIGSEFINHRW